ncbi:NADPH-dependent ferric siderophore reductase, contains FAD-binding and SIP domains [Streptomyces sp. Ncost-T6T-1]|uniref:Siderophore-interacting protein n=1 Tax=Streptomyces parvus TaxID=66428 RepID=A0A7K3SA08_9ACTN|nr:MULTISPECIES: siderophore-interacting protein [Streptomyces]NEC24311.1 siderophore-interacting protein [Streptomyces parvus]SBU93420.1 NADPH-dependent ferric siderophore reductase, contains FAD-binding and SIP domains [Streptomyces sp. Ncost-T6T-1]
MSSTAPVVAEVTRVTPLSPGMVRLTLHSESLRDYPSTRVGDEYVRLHFPAEDGELVLPEVGEDGDWQYPDGQYPHIQPYTLRRFDPEAAEVDIDFVLHGHGRATAWAAGATPGDRLFFGPPRSLYEAPGGAARQVFVTDATGLPALGRLLEQLDPATHAVAVVEIADASHRIELTSPARLDVRWVAGRGNGVGPSAITEILRGLDLTPGTYVWVAGESGELRSARRHLRHERKLPAEWYAVIGYWRHQQEEWLEKYRALDAETLAELNGIWDRTEDEELRRDLYEAGLERLGL